MKKKYLTTFLLSFICIPLFTQNNPSFDQSSPSWIELLETEERLDKNNPFTEKRTPPPQAQKNELNDSRKRKSYPATAHNIPSGFGLSFMDFFIGGIISHRERYNNNTPDAVLYVGLGLGNPKRFVGLDVSANITDVKGEFAADGSFNAKLHRHIPWGISSISLGVNSFSSWGRNSNVPSYYLAFSRHFWLKYNYLKTFTFHIGVGNGFFVSEDHHFDLFRIKNRGAPGDLHDFTKWGPFAGISLGIFDWMNFLADWNGQDLNLTLSFAPLSQQKLLINVGAKDLTGNAGSGNIYFISMIYANNFLNFNTDL